MICENIKCNNEHDGTYGSGRFCSLSCANVRQHTKEDKRKCNTRGRPRKNPDNIFDVSSRTTRKILTRMNLKCSHCGWNKDICDIHHINGKKIENPNNHRNLSYLCPNCHRLAGKGKILKEELINLYDYVGDNWKQHYYNLK